MLWFTTNDIENFTMMKNARGFTLVEMAVVLIIVGLMLGGVLLPLTAQMEQRHREETRVILDDAKEALIGFAMVHKYLPCPDTNAIPDGSEGARSGVPHQCTTAEGILPWQVLGVQGKDGWERYIRYRVTPAFTADDSANYFTLSSTGGITINSDVGTLTTSAIAALVSHGPNGFGAINTIQATPANQMPAPAGADELMNTDGNATFISHTPTPQGSANEFDDSVVWLSPNILFSRMVAASQLP